MMIKKNLIFTVSILSIMMLIGYNMQSTNSFEFIIDGTYDTFITMGTSADYAPYAWLINDGHNQTTVVGIDIVITKEIAKASGKNLRSFYLLNQHLH